MNPASQLEAVQELQTLYESLKTEMQNDDSCILVKSLDKWRHWKPHMAVGLTPVGQRQLELQLQDKWLNRTLSHLVPHAKNIPNTQKFLS